MDFLYKLLSGDNWNSQTIETDGKVIHKQISLCCKDVSVTRVPILKQNAGVTLVILNAVKAIKYNQDEFQGLANHAADLIVGIWRSYKKSKAPEQWLSPPLRDILRGLLENLESMREFVEEQMSMNVCLRIICNAVEMQQINRYHQRLTVIFDKFEIQSHITANSILIQLLDKQKQMSNQIKQRNNVKNADKNPQDKVNKGFSEKRSIGVLPRARSDKTTKKPVKITQKAKRRTPDRSSNIDHLSEAEDAALPLNTPWNTTRSPMNLVPPLPSIYNWSWNTDAGHNAGNWTHPSCTFSGKGVIINQGVGNAIHSNFSNINNDRSANYYHY